MSSVSRRPVVLPETLCSVLDIRTRKGLVCPTDIADRLQKMPFFRGKSSGGTSNTRFTNLTHATPDGWRTVQSNASSSSRFQTISHKPSHPVESEDGFEVWTNRKKNTFARNTAYSHSPPVTTAPSQTVESSSNAWKSSRFKPLEDKIATESIEERIMGKVRSKINKIGESTYAPTKAFMQQILDSGNTEFLEEFMEFVFQKAATESSFCPIYARLLHELADEFPHLRTEMQLRFREYTTIFVETEKTPDVGTTDYIKFVESQEKKKFRRGYSQFVAELAKLGEVNFEDFRSLLESIVNSILQVYKISENVLLCEEYVDCLSRMCQAGASMLSKESWANNKIKVLDEISASPRSSSPGLSNKARFALMDLQDFVARGWK